MKLVFSAQARSDLIGIGDVIARDKPARALSFVEEIEARCRKLPAMPLAYSLTPRHESSGVRRMVHGNYLVFYRVVAEAVVILHILHGAMNIETILFPDDKA